LFGVINVVFIWGAWYGFPASSFFLFLELGAAASTIVHRGGHGSVAFWTLNLGWWIKRLATLSAELVFYRIFTSAP